MARNPALWIRVPNGGTPDNPAVYTAIRDSLREISEAVRLLQGGPSVTSSATQQAASSAAAAYTNSGPNIYLPLDGGTMTGLLVTAAPTTSSAGLRLPHGTAPSAPTNGDIWTTTAGLYARINGTTVGPFSAATGVYLPLAGGTMTGLLTTVASGTSSAGFNLPHGVAPTTPVNGDLWTTTTGIYARINGATVGPLAATPTGQALTRTNDTNVTLTLGGSPTTALLAATSLTLGWSGQLALGRGGTGADLSATGGTGQYVKQATMGGAFTVGTIPASDIASGQALTRVNDTNVTLTLGGAPTTALLSAASLTLGWSGQLSIARGGTGQSTATAAFDALSPLTTLGDIIYHNGTDNVRLAGNTTTTRLFLAQTGTGTVSAAPTWTNVAASDVVSGAALTKADDTNVTLTLGGTPTSALLKAVSLTLGWTGTLAQSRGGFGANISSVLQNRVYASPDGAAGSPTFRALVAADIPSLSGTYLPLAGGTMSGAINMSSNNITNVAALGVGGAASASYPMYVTKSNAAVSGFSDLSVFTHYAAPTVSSTAENTAVYAATYIQGTASVTGRGRVVWGELYANSTFATSDVSAIMGNIVLSSTGNVTNAIAVHAGAPTASSTGRITGYAAGVYIDAQTGGAVTGTAYGIYQASTSDKNILAGNVRIGSTTTATNALDVTGAATVSGNFAVDTDTLFVDATSNEVGIGTIAPAQKLDVAGTLIVTGNSDMPTSAGTNIRITGGYASPDIGRVFIGDGTGWKLHFSSRTASTNTDRVTIQDNGNFFVDTNVLYVDAVNNRVGVNMTPTVALDVTGSAKITSNFTVDTDTLFVDATNNAVSIGTTGVTKKFNVTQTQNAETASLTYNVDAGSSAKASWLLYTNAYAGLEMSSSAGGGGLKLYNPNTAGLLFESVSQVRQRIPGVKSVTDAVATGVVTLTLSAASFAGCTIIYTVEATNGTDHQAKSGIVHVAAARNTAGTAATPQVSDTVTATSTTSGTLGTTWTATYASGLVTVYLNADTSLAPSANYPRVRYTIFNNGSEGLTVL